MTRNDVDAWKDKCEQMAAELACESALRDIVNDKVEVDVAQVASTLATKIIEREAVELVPTEAIDAGVEAAISEIDEDAYDNACNAMQSRVTAEIEGQAKRIALRMIRELAAKAERDAATAG